MLETIAGVPGMIGAMTRHFHALRRLTRDNGWIHTLLGTESRQSKIYIYIYRQDTSAISLWLGSRYLCHYCLVKDIKGEKKGWKVYWSQLISIETLCTLNIWYSSRSKRIHLSITTVNHASCVCNRANQGCYVQSRVTLNHASHPAICITQKLLATLVIYLW